MTLRLPIDLREAATGQWAARGAERSAAGSFQMRRQITWNPAGKAGTILIEREELYASVDRVAQEDRETVADLNEAAAAADASACV
jgi:hypothetical protein